MQGQHLLQHQLDHVPVLGSGRVEQEVVVLGISATALERKAIYVFRLKMSSLAHLRPILHKHLLGCKLSENHLVVDVVLLPDDDDGDNDVMTMMMTMMMMCSCLTRFTACSKLTPSRYSSDRTDVILCQVFFSWFFSATPQMRKVDLLFPCVQTSKLSNRPIGIPCSLSKSS